MAMPLMSSLFLENYLCSWRLLRTFQEKVDETYLEAILYCCFYHPVYEEVSINLGHIKGYLGT